MKRFFAYILTVVTALFLCSCAEAALDSEPVAVNSTALEDRTDFAYEWLSKITSITATLTVDGEKKTLPLEHAAVIQLCNYFALGCEAEGYIYTTDSYFDFSDNQTAAQFLRIDLEDGCQTKDMFPFMNEGANTEDAKTVYDTGTISTIWIQKETGESCLIGRTENNNEIQVAFCFNYHRELPQYIADALNAE